MARLISRLRRWLTGSGTESGSGSGTDAGSGSDSDTGSDTGSGTDAGSGSESGSDSGPDPDTGSDPDTESDPAPTITVPITDQLDLHTFRPAETASVVDEYLHAAQALGLTRVRVIHGKGKGVQRDIVRRVLRRHPAVAHFQPGGDRGGSWGATLVDLHPRTP